MNENMNSPIESGTQEQAKNIQVHVSRERMTTAYANAFQPLPSADEIMLDFGLNHAIPKMSKPGEDNVKEMALDFNHRVVMNYSTAKKLAITLAQVLKDYEKNYGDIPVNLESRRIHTNGE